MNIDNLLSTHPSYTTVSNQAEYLLRSYLGGDTYRGGEYLTQYIGEETSPGDQYGKRLKSTPLDNHVQTVVDIYRSFLFRDAPVRELGNIADNPLVQDWLHDTDQEGQGMDSFLKTANDYASVMGNVWLLVDKPSYKVNTQAEAEALGIRGYAAMYTPMSVLDWHYERNIAGKMVLEYIKVKESDNPDNMVITLWTKDLVQRHRIAKDDQGNPHQITETQQFDNPLGEVPFINHSPIRSTVKGVGHSLVADTADAQRYIYNLYSELEQTIRISGHPTLVKTQSTSAAAGAGAIINMDNDTDPGLKPFLLQPTAAGVNGILDTIEKVSEGIKRMTHTSAVQATKGSPMSGVALQTERQLLNAKLSDMADTLNETELQLWDLWLKWQGLTKNDDFNIEYSKAFDMRDNGQELAFYLQAKQSGVNTPAFQKELDRQIAMVSVDNKDNLQEILDELDTEFVTHVMVNPETGESVVVESQEQHEALMAQGYSHL